MSASLYAVEFEKMLLAGYEKRILSEKQIRFESKTQPKDVVHIQVHSIGSESKWKAETLDKDIKVMFKNRIEMYEIFGFKDVKFSSYKLAEYEKMPILYLLGSYKKINNKKVYFAEGNLYFKEHFLQVKLIRESEKESDAWKQSDLDKILKEIKGHELEI